LPKVLAGDAVATFLAVVATPAIPIILRSELIILKGCNKWFYLGKEALFINDKSSYLICFLIFLVIF